MNFLHPLAFAGLLLALPLAALYYIAWGQRRQQAVGAIMLWEQALARRSKFSGLQRLLSLAAVLFLLTMVVLAIAGPYFGDLNRQPRTVMIVVDGTSSMLIDDSRFAAAIEQAVNELDQLEPGDRAGLILFSQHVELLTPPTDNLAELREQLRRLQPIGGSASAEQAIILARRMIGNEEAARIVLLTDGAIDLPETSIDDRLSCHVMGESIANVAITNFVLREAAADGRDDFALVTLRNFSEQPASATLSMQGMSGTREINLAAGERKTVLWPTDLKKLPDERPWRVTARTDDVAGFDDQREAGVLYDPRVAEATATPRRNEGDLQTRVSVPEPPALARRGPLPTWLWPAVLAAATVLMVVEFVLFQRRLFI